MQEKFRNTSNTVLTQEDRENLDRLKNDGHITIDENKKITLHGFLVKGIDHAVDLNQGVVVELGLPEIPNTLLTYLREISDWNPDSTPNKLKEI